MDEKIAGRVQEKCTERKGIPAIASHHSFSEAIGYLA
jgi:hypothetical protein